MAEDIVHEGKSLEELKKDITCAICQEHYTEPKVLPCLHYYCKKCILRLALSTATNQPFPCPECRKETTLPEGGVDELKTAFFVHRLKDMYSIVERVHCKVEVKCEGCTDSGDKAEAFCRQCTVFICMECIKQHKRMKAFASHKVDSLEDLKRGQAREMAVKEPPIKKCHTHEEPLMVYCFDCNSLICRDCTVTAHRDHKYEFSKVAAPSTKKKLLEELDPLRDVSASLSHALEEVQITKHEIEVQGRDVVNTIQISFDNLHKILEKNRQEMLHKADQRVQEKIKNLLSQDKNLSLAKTEVQSIVDYTERFVSHCSDNEVMSMHADIRSQIRCEIEEHGKADRIVEPVEEADMGVEVRCAEVLQQLCQTRAKITKLPIVGTIDNTSSEVNQLSQVTLTVRLSNNQPSRRKFEIDMCMKSLCYEAIVICDVAKTEADRYSIKYTPNVSGCHELTVSVDGEKLAGSPFPMFVSVPPTSLGKPVKVWSGINNPTGIATNSMGEIIVTCEGDIIKFDREGKESVLVRHSETKLAQLRSITTDDEDNLYCIDFETNKIMTCNKYGGNIQVQEVQQVNGPGHWGIAIVGDEVMLCERNNIGNIMVYDKELKHVRHIEHYGTEFRGICADCHGNIYVVEFYNPCLRVFSNDGIYIHSIGCHENELKCPNSLCVSGHYVYVTDWVSASVLVLTTAGEYVTSFGRYGSKEGDFDTPRGVCVDRAGRLYVADHNRVQCFS